MKAFVLASSMALYALLAIGALALPMSAARRRVFGFGGIAAASAALATSGALLAFAGETLALSAHTSAPGFDLAFRVDPLAGVFLALLGTAGTAVGVYAIGYVPLASRDHFSLRAQVALLAAFLLAVTLVIASDHALAFLIAWESMSLTSYLLVLSHGDDDVTQRAASTYLVMTHLGTAFLLVSFAALAAAAGGRYDFESMREHAHGAPEFLRSIAFMGAVVGFGTKAGLVPVHAWLPQAHPEAPSHVSALMSGVMLKTAVYMMIRVSLDFLSPGPPWWGILLLVLGSATTFIGILYATTENDLKRLLAYSSIENLGVIFMSLGLAVLFRAYGANALATLALVAAVLHSLNHMAMKTLLFMGAGNVLHATGSRDIDRLGGLVHRMPATSALFLVGALAISALPPLNGFASEWLLFQSLLAGVTLPETPLLLQIFLPVGAAFFALAGALSVVCYVKAFGATFLAVPRSAVAEHAHEASPFMLAGMALPAAAILFLAALAGPAITTLTGVLAAHADAVGAPPIVRSGVVIQSLTDVRSSMSPTLVFVAVLGFAAATFAATRFLGSRARERREETWLCGHRALHARMEYTGTAYAEATRMFFTGLYGAERTLAREHSARHVVARVSYAARTTYYIEKLLYDPLVRLVLLTSARFRVIQAGSVHAYLTYIFSALMIALLVVTR